jgi:hypothetical protein
MAAMTDISAPIFVFGDNPPLPDTDKHLRNALPEGTYALSGPGVTAEAGRLPVRGDLAHIKLAGRYFVPHYAVPMPHPIAAGGAVLRKIESDDAEALCSLSAGSNFDVLDISGNWAWGQVTGGSFGKDGPVGYVALAQLAKPGA